MFTNKFINLNSQKRQPKSEKLFTLKLCQGGLLKHFCFVLKSSINIQVSQLEPTISNIDNVNNFFFYIY